MIVHVVEGAPCSGKTSFVENKMTQQDIVYDYDKLVTALGKRGGHTVDKHISHSVALKIRQQIIDMLKRGWVSPDNAYIITRSATKALKDSLEGLTVEYHKMEATLEECLARLALDNDRPDKEAWTEIITAYFEENDKEDKKMDKLEKFKSLSIGKADAEKDIDLINKYSVEPLTPEEVYCFSVVLCDNDIDRDTERFVDESLDALAPLFLGKTGICDHRWNAREQKARIYRCEVEDTGKKNKLGEPLKVLRACAYMLASQTEIVDAIKAGIMKEVSVGVSMGACTCSICGAKMGWSGCRGEEEHEKGKKYDGKLCIGELKDAKDAYEFSFVAVPAQPGAGVTKSLESLSEQVEDVKANLDSVPLESRDALMLELQKYKESDEDRKKREKSVAKAKEIKEKYQK